MLPVQDGEGCHLCAFEVTRRSIWPEIKLISAFMTT